MTGQVRRQNLECVFSFVAATVKFPDWYSSVSSAHIVDGQVVVSVVLTESGMRHSMLGKSKAVLVRKLQWMEEGKIFKRNLAFNMIDFIIYCTAHGAMIRELFYAESK